MELDQEMPDFADMFNFGEPATPSPMRRLRDEDSPEVEHPVPSDLAGIPSDQLFSKYLTSESDTAEGGYSPSDPPFIAGREVTTSVTELESLVTKETQTVEPNPITPVPETETRLPPTEEVYDLSVHSISDGVITNATLGIEPESLATKETPTVEPNPITPVPETEELSSPQQQEPLDLRVIQHEQLPRTKLIPTECQTPVIDCTTPTGVWYKPMSIDVGDKCMEHMCLDPRLFFAGAPSHYLQHPLAKSLNEKIVMSRQSTKSRYQRKLVPLGVRSIMKEERCYLPNGSMIEMRDTWTMDNNDATEE
jgi:hypothetical protein